MSKTDAIWAVEVSPSVLNQLAQNTMAETLGIVFTEIGKDFIRARMPVDQRTRQYLGILHGGASVALAETVASTASNLVVNPQTHYCLGLEINANHLRSVKEGYVWAEARPIHLGRTTHVWDIRIYDEATDKLVAIVRHTVIVLNRLTNPS
ncbi:MAG: PaaI family thioesterase [Bacteroidia bacterium]|nr:PaaI family thioesterase [Bacteroidia bacterium]MCX7652806.1 PaaI family thioesterase [Bacteroidia bacterium]MDW8417227.1 PaaI family thioesterase [Bacteroidia bacterium]